MEINNDKMMKYKIDKKKIPLPPFSKGDLDEEVYNPSPEWRGAGVR
jgi:hypothetical protein